MFAKKCCADEMSTALLIQSRERAAYIVNRESRGPGDLDNAMRRLETKRGVPYTVLWAFRYRPPKDILVSIYLKIECAFNEVCEEERKRLEHSIQISRLSARPGAPDSLAIRAGLALAGKKGGALQ